MKLLLIILILILSTSCLKLRGELLVKNKLDFIDKGIKSIPEGSYSSSLKFLSSKKLILKLRSDEQKFKVKIKLPKKINIPNQENGVYSFNISSSNQPFNLSGEVLVSTKYSEIKKEEESCRLNTSGTQCVDIWIGQRRNRDIGYYDYRCTPNYVMGIRDVYFQTKTMIRDSTIKIEQDNQQKAIFSGNSITYGKKIIRQTRCSLY
jgi:hypothetical protein